MQISWCQAARHMGGSCDDDGTSMVSGARSTYLIPVVWVVGSAYRTISDGVSTLYERAAMLVYQQL